MWQCKKCGSCCKILNTHLPKRKEDQLVIKELNRGDGICRHLSEDNLCMIYEDRPNICRVDINDVNLPKACEKVRTLKGAIS